jgi:hypothetical protein
MKFLKDQSGQTLVVVAVFMALVGVGFLAIALDAGSLFRQKRLAQAAADAAAVAAAEEAGSSNQQTVANSIAKLNGFDTTLATNPAVVSITTPATGNFTGTSYVQVTVTKPIHNTFLGAFSSSLGTMSVSAQAVAGGKSSQTCVCLEDSSGQDLTMSNGSQLTAAGCGVVVNSSSSDAIGLIGGATLSGLSLGTVSSSWNTSSNINNGGSISSSTLIIQGITSTCSPIMPTPPTYSNCLSDPGGTSISFVAGPSSASGVICYKSLTVGANGTLDTLNPGTYVITTGALHFENGSGGHSNLGGDGVFFYLTGTATLAIDNGANVNLVAGGNTTSGGGTAPTVGAYNGILFYQEASDTADISIQGGSTAYLNGALYAPSSAVTLGNGSGTTLLGGIVASTLTMYGGGTLKASANTNEGSLSITSPKLVQ